MNYVHLKHHVVVHKICECGFVCHDSAYLCCRKHYDFGFFFFEKRFNIVLTYQIEFCVASLYGRNSR